MYSPRLMPPAPFRTDRPIALVGPMGAGKSTVGRRLAERLGLPFVDSDAEIERSAGLAVAEIFERHGEAHFRESERRVVARLVEGPARVIATGGGAFADPKSRALIRARCTVVWLDAPPEALAERASRHGGRPLLAGREPLPFFRELAEERRPAYAEAHLRVATADSPEATVELVLEALGAR